MRLILIRHGDPNYEKDCLTEKGKREAALLAERIGDTAHLYRGGEPISPSGYFTEVMQEIQK